MRAVDVFEQNPQATSHAFRSRPAEFDAASTEVLQPTLAALDADGVVRINGALAPAVTAGLLAHVNDALDEALRCLWSELAFESGDSYVKYFGNVLGRSNRHDLKLDLRDPPVALAVTTLLQALHPVLAARLGEEASLYELAALVSDPKAPRQPLHPDTPCRSEQGPAVLTAFVALQDIDETMVRARALARQGPIT